MEAVQGEGDQAVQGGAIPVAGRLRSIRLEDFMCHKHLFVEFSQVSGGGGGRPA
jgi:hypothetical protein